MQTAVAPEFCFIPRDVKDITIYESGAYINKTPSFEFKHLIDCDDNAKIIFIKRKQKRGSEIDFDDLSNKILQEVKNTWGVTELSDNKLVWETYNEENYQTPYYTFSIYTDSNGIVIKSGDLKKVNEKNAVICHKYVFDFYSLCHRDVYNAFVEIEKATIM